MTRPQELILIPDESYPVKRKINAKIPAKNKLTIDNMPAMAEYVYKAYTEQVKTLSETMVIIEFIYDNICSSV